MPRARAPFELFAGVGQHGDGRDGGVERRAKMGFKFLQRDVREQFGVEFPVRQPEGAAESFAVERGDFIFPEHGIRRLDHRAEIVHKRAGPIENEVAKHGGGKCLGN